ncbi:hypothetical protein [Paenibacillus sp. LPE1-1-1.1]|uniref:hypothetical protein n=1 Tax=Paenibacillus sp. LPE1-1-1.1 TaxID=3135230 RepID=UPI003442FE6D
MANVNQETIKSQIKSHQALIGGYLLNNTRLAHDCPPYLFSLEYIVTILSHLFLPHHAKDPHNPAKLLSLPFMLVAENKKTGEHNLLIQLIPLSHSLRFQL